MKSLWTRIREPLYFQPILVLITHGSEGFLMTRPAQTKCNTPKSLMKRRKAEITLQYTSSFIAVCDDDHSCRHTSNLIRKYKSAKNTTVATVSPLSSCCKNNMIFHTN